MASLMNNTTYSIVFSDIDRTLLTHRYELPENVIKATQQLVDHGFQFILASARSPSGIRKIHNYLPASATVVAYNGAWIGNIITGIPEVTFPVSYQIALRAFDSIREMGGTPIWYSDHGAYACRSDEAIAAERNHVTGDELILVNESKGLPKTVYKVMAVFTANDIQKGQEKLTQMIGKDVSVSRSGPGLIEIVSNNSDKSLAVQHICKKMRWDLKKVAAAGDSENDFKMLSLVGCALTVANGTDEIREISQYIGESCDVGGIASAFDWLIEQNNKGR